MKIGLLVNNIEKLENWKLRIVTYLLNEPNIDLVLLLKNVNDDEYNCNPNPFKTPRFFGVAISMLFKIQKRVEAIVYKPINSVDKNTILAKLKKVETVDLIAISPENSFTNSAVEIIKSLKLDLILQSDFSHLKGSILNAATYGIWSLRNNNYFLKENTWFGLEEIVNRKDGVEVTLEKCVNTNEDRICIDKAFFNSTTSFFKTQATILESSVSLVVKNIDSILKGQELVTTSFKVNKVETISLLRYFFDYYKSLFNRVYEKVSYSLFGTRYNCWALFMGTGDFLEAKLESIVPVKLPKNEFWADPFLLKHENELYVFFENYEYDRALGKISCAKIVNGEVMPATDVLVKDYHLSYPFIFKEGDELFLMPETSQNNRLEIYRCTGFPNKWELYKTAFEGERIVDTTLYTDKDGIKWLFLNKSVDPNVSFANELFIYQISSSLKTLNLIPHEQNPVLIDASVARNGGGIFKNNGRLYRPSQANIQGVYGRALNINEISVLTIERYEEQTIKRISPNFNSGLKAMHHLHQIEDYFVFDASYAVYR
mgnify:CR=1 FL=1